MFANQLLQAVRLVYVRQYDKIKDKMPKHKEINSQIQNDPVLFAEVCRDIKMIGPVVLDRLGLVSRTTISAFRDGEAITAEKEDAIIASIKLWKAHQKKESLDRAERLREVLIAP